MSRRAPLAALLLVLGCSSPGSVAGPPPAELPLSEPSSESTMADLTELPIQLSPGNPTWRSAHERVEANAVIRDVPAEMRQILQTGGDPRGRLIEHGNALNRARLALAQSGAQGDGTSGGLDLVALDLQLCFYRDLAAAIAAAEAPRSARQEALESLRALILEPPPLGLPAPNDRVEWTMTARATADEQVRAQLEKLAD